jgi:hypothetical protein
MFRRRKLTRCISRPFVAAPSGFTLISNGASTGAQASPRTTGAIDTTGANLLVVAASQFGSVTIGTVTDSKGNTWTPLTAQNQGTTYINIFYCVPSSVGSGHTFTWSNGADVYGAVAVQAWSGAHASPFDTENGATTSTLASLATGSITPAQNNSLVIAALCAGDLLSTPFTINGGFTETAEVASVPSTVEGLSMAYLVQTTAAAANPTFSWVGGAERASVTIAAFKPA